MNKGSALRPRGEGGFVLDPRAHAVNHARSEFDDKEGVQDHDRFGQLFIDRVGVAAERVKGGDLDSRDESGPSFLEPVAVGLAAAARDQIQRPRPHLALGVSGVVDDSGDHPATGKPGMPPHVLVNTQRVDAFKPGRVTVFQGGRGRVVVPDGVPVHAEVPGNRRNGDCLLFHQVKGPVDGADGEFFAWADAGVFLGGGHHGAGAFPAPDDPFAPLQFHGIPLNGSVVDRHAAPGLGC